MRTGRLLLLFLVGFLNLAIGQTTDNLALNKPVSGTGPTWPGYPPANLTDGDRATFTHPQASSGIRGYYFQVDLGQSFLFERIELFSRSDGCCPERLSRYRVEIYADRQGETGVLNWTADIRLDGTFPPSGGSDVILAAADPAGVFGGRFVRIVNISDAPYNPQLAEIEVYGAPGPRIERFESEDDVLSVGQSTTLRWTVSNATTVTLTPGPGVVGHSGELIIQPTSTITYKLQAAGVTGKSETSLTVGVGVGLGPPKIDEFLAENSGGLLDEDGDSSDWIELVNTNSFRLNLEGYQLSDDPKVPTKWKFPAVRIASGGRLVVFASGKDRRVPSSPLHTNFKLTASGDYLSLVAPDGVSVLQQFPADYPATKTFPAQRANISFGRGANDFLGFMRPATPGQTNRSAFQGIVADTSFSLDRGFYETNITVAIASSTTDAQIRYTLDRTEPTATTGQIYTAPISISNTTILRAAAFREGWAPTDVDTHTYVYPSNVIAAANMRTSVTKNSIYAPQMKLALLDLPSISVSTRATINDTSEVKTSFEWIRPDGVRGTQVDCGVQRFGGAFTDFAKKNFRFYFREQYGASKLRYPLFAGFERGYAAAEEFDQIELRTGSHDMEMRGFYMSNIFTDDTVLEMGHLNPHGRFVHLYLNGAYWGVYHMRERWGAAMHANYLGGSKTNYESINGNWNVGGWAEPGTPYDGDGSTWRKIKTLRNSYRSVRPWLDVSEYVDYMLMWMFGGSEDEYRCVGPTVPGSGMKFYLNDADGWFCGSWYCAADDRSRRGAPGRQAGDGPGSLLSTLFAEGDPEFRTLLADQIHRALFQGGALTPERLIARLKLRTDEMSRPFLAESARWNYLTPSVWAQRRDSVLTNWLLKRTTEVRSQWRAAGFYPSINAPTLNQPGGVVSNNFRVQFTGPGSGSIWFTTDGSDPRLIGGAVSPQARSYSTGQDQVTVIPAGSRWRWFTDATGLGSSAVVEGAAGWTSSNWKHPNFSDSTWSEGPAQLGYGENDEATKIPFGGDSSKKWPSSYFRKKFAVDSIQGLSGWNLRLKRDDGAIVYVNGREVLRSSMPDGNILATTAAQNSPDDGQSFSEFPIAATFFKTGDNVVAVELHQSGPTTSDASFDLELTAISNSGNSGGDAIPLLDRNTILFTRTKNGAQWSALSTAFFQVGDRAVGPGDVVVSELSFNPAGPDESEFIELQNISQRAVNLRGCRFTNGVEYAFSEYRDQLLASGQRLVLVRDLFAFQQRYGIDVPVGGIFKGRLDNGGESIAFVDAQGGWISGFTYDGAHPWPVDADGHGRTLVLARPELDLSNPLAWRSSATTNGSPGGSDTLRFTGTPDADADRDGWNSVLEYAMGASDQDVTSPGNLLPKFRADGMVVLELSRNPAADDVTLWVEWSTDLSEWTETTRHSQRVVEGGHFREVWGPPVTNGIDPVFLRILARLVR